VSFTLVVQQVSSQIPYIQKMLKGNMIRSDSIFPHFYISEMGDQRDSSIVLEKM
jgi:hypothetical protein